MDALADVCLRHGGLSGRGAVPFGLVKQETASLVPFWLFCSPSPGGPLLDTCALFTQTAAINWETAKAIYLSGVPINCIHGVATFLTLFFFSRPLFEKLDRVQLKYGMMEDGYGV